VSAPKPKPSAAEQAYETLAHPMGHAGVGQGWAVLALAEAITTASRTLAAAMVESARIRRGQA